MKIKLLQWTTKITFGWSVFSLIGISQNVGIGTITPDPSAKLHIVSSTQGVLIPSVGITSISNASPVVNPAVGLLIFNDGSGNVSPIGFYWWNGYEWRNLIDSVVTKNPLIGDGTIGNPVSLQGGNNAGDVLIWDGSQWQIKPSPFDSVCGTAMANYVQKWTGTELCNSIIYDDGTRVGIGTNNPVAFTHIQSSAFNDLFLIDTPNSVVPHFVVTKFGNVGIGVPNPTQLLVAKRDSNYAVGAYLINSSSGVLARAILAVRSDSGQGSFFITSSNYAGGGNIANSIVVAAEKTADNIFLIARKKDFGKGRIYMLPRQGSNWPPTMTIDSGVVCVNCVPGSDDYGLLVVADTFVNDPNVWGRFYGISLYRNMPLDGNQDNAAIQLVNLQRSALGSYRYSLYLGDPDGGYGVIPDAFEIWEYPDSVGTGTCCRQRFRILSSRGLNNPPPVTISNRGWVSIGLPATNTNVTNILTIVQGSPTDPIADSWTVYSTRETKAEVIGVVSQEDMSKYLKYFREMPVYKWRRTEGEQLRLSPMADDAGVPGEIRAYDAEGNVQGIDLYGYIGFLHTVILALDEQYNREIVSLKQRIAELEKQLQQALTKDKNTN